MFQTVQQQTRCPVCNDVQPTVRHNENELRAGMFCLCWTCGAVSVFAEKDDGLELVNVTEEQARAMPNETVESLSRLEQQRVKEIDDYAKGRYLQSV